MRAAEELIEQAQRDGVGDSEQLRRVTRHLAVPRAMQADGHGTRRQHDLARGVGADDADLATACHPTRSRRRLAMRSSSYPSSRRIASVCSPSFGAGPDRSDGLPENTTGSPDPYRPSK